MQQGMAQAEAFLIKACTDEGRQRARARGIRFGRKLKLTPHQRREALARREAGEALADIGRTFGVSHSTISRLKAENERLHSSSRWLDQQVMSLRQQRSPVPLRPGLNLGGRQQDD
jgi:DNA invertase Pin-like site-specific DNA recombinase